MFSLRFALNKCARYNGAAGTNESAPSNLERMNDVREMIFERGDWVGTTEWVHVNIFNGGFVLPLHLEVARSAYSCHGGAEIQNKFYAVVDRDFAYTNVIRQGGRAVTANFRESGFKAPYFCNTPCTPFRLFVTNDNEEDNGTVVGFNVKKDGQSVCQQITLAGMKGVINESNISHWVSINKEPTKGWVYVWTVEASGREVMVAEYPPQSVMPHYRHYNLVNCAPSAKGSLVVFAKRKCWPMDDLNQQVDIESLDSLIFAYKAKNAQEAEDNTTYVNALQLMENHLEKADRNLDMNEPSVPMMPTYDSLLDSRNEAPFGPYYGRP